ncbi:hypothetical protein AVEN_73296-1, partial [Araneus ventricosus]
MCIFRAEEKIVGNGCIEDTAGVPRSLKT